MTISYAINNLKSLRLIPKPPLNLPLSSSLYLHTRSLPPHKQIPTYWNTTNSFVLSNPLLSLLEKSQSLAHLTQIQSQMIITGLILDGFASSRLIAFCAISQSRNLDYGIKTLFNVRNPNVFSWNVSIRGCLESGKFREAIFLYRQMLTAGGSRPDNYTYPLLLKVCASLSVNYIGHEILCHVLKMGFDSDIYVHNAVIHLLASFGELEAAHKVFDGSCVRDLVSWNSLINGYIRSGRAQEAIRIYRELEAERVKPDEVTMIGIVSACAQLGDLKLGREFHLYITESGVNLNVSLANVLMDMYMKCGDVDAARKMFDSMEMKTIVSWTTMVVGYAKCGLLDTARKLFEDMPEKDVVPWNAIIGGYVQAKHCKGALALFNEMQANNVKPDEVTMVLCLSACAQLGALDGGIWIHRYIEKHNLYLNVALGTALVDMYAKCGNITRALQIFREMPERNNLTFTAIIGGLALHGNANDAISYFSEMTNAGLMPDEITFLGVLSACCHGGLVEEGRKYFAQMNCKFNLSPQLKHYSCMVDLLGRAGLLEEAEELITSMPIKADAVVWGALFFACRMHGNVLMGERVASKLLELDPHDSGIYVLLANMYGEANLWNDARKVRKMMRRRGVEKIPGCSSVEVNGIVSEFIVRDESHPQSQQIYECVVQLTRQLELVECILSAPTFRDNSLLGYEIES
ncbi:PPR domain-containing protein/PPR_1 domain-containing protein/PPR_2 domain-containing protein [Cephalotus follicularis]|uniref:PPR domain-containing protein/PPR_1 domain-containing protein/PPR_2 domain-containing protein n=1 Tax=Cephalotus follicularis TaxID=3775 RepID=A0A1Q3B6C2_CEPFO|nr:PPR domain-containing protein/PPR_1 domain-containing protein/PPR_2 domain-containing protein [Cephalotus follicularis]